ncbi:putative transmembrane protein [Cinnamomum micranthum f. kanehirae]|uniref:Putative transmembrane protein n=1 Tax=Cinnamomum micranthum f. kanehirae TaxID=337451 RepID=A0A443NEC5_9MAGN|nr:putative transmembrane protein [Cinnamomum micranthum f. kanehirae]
MQLFGGQSCNTDRNTRIWIQWQYERNTEFDERIILADQPISNDVFPFAGTLSSTLVTLESIQIFNKHEPIFGEPSVYFRCQGENKTMLPDVKKTHLLYTFRGAESWQPLTELPGNKCKRCGLYEEDHLTPDDCPTSGEYSADTIYAFYVVFADSARSSRSKDDSDGKGMNVLLVILISVLVSGVALIGAVAGYRYWQKKKREQDQARFLKLFEEGDDVEDELD